MDKKLEDLEPEWEKLNTFANENVPTEVLYAPVRYAAMDPAKEGTWQDVTYDGKRVGLIWTDWNDASGTLPMYSNEFFDDLDDYLAAAKSAGVQAGQAFSSLKAYIADIGPEGISIGETNSGPLSQALQSVLGDDKQRNGDE